MDRRSRTPGPFEALATCLTRPFVWGGRAAPSEFWWYAVPFLLVQAAALTWLVLPPARVVLLWHAAYADAELRAAASQLVEFRPPPFPDVSIPIRWMSFDWGAWFFGSILPALSFVSVSVRRLHDTGHSGWWLWLCLIPGVGLALVLLLLVAPGEMHRNRYGAGRGATVIVGPRASDPFHAAPPLDGAAALRALRESRMQA